MGRPSRFSPEVQERALRVVTEQRPAHPSEWAELQAVVTKLDTTAETLRRWYDRGSVTSASARA
ncbi:MAG TPA: hypothetical protein VMO26_20005 [Vicinamibacterales bacterium]|nr:hypothetical protein [Vicinamibacterales bacterium]